jgi:type II secretory pathway predicted ATPase ExeA
MIELFKRIGLDSDPFTTSPNVEKFYPATQHRQCLEGLELAIRMRRGLSVIRGGIGVGKTTVSRKLIEIFKNESNTYNFHLILDPKFDSELVFLKHIIDLFGIKTTGDDVQGCRNIIENYLLKTGIDEKKVTVLIVDEGQNLPAEMIDVFRTLLNFETDEYKLLQLIIFGQPEMTKLLKNYPNFEDRIAFNFELGPVSLEDTRGLIDYRVENSGGEKGAWFSDDAIKMIHDVTDGYPRKITQICHQLLLTMIGDERTAIDADMVARVTAGQTPDAENLKKLSEVNNYDDIAVNRLLDVLRKKDKEENSETEIIEKSVSDSEVEEVKKEEVLSEPLIEESSPPPKRVVEEVEQVTEKAIEQASEVVQKKEGPVQVTEVEKTENLDDEWIGSSTTPKLKEEENDGAILDESETYIGSDLEDEDEDETPAYQQKSIVVPQDPLNDPGVYDQGLQSFNTFFDPASIGVNIDGNHLSSVMINNTKGVKTLISYEYLLEKNKKEDFFNEPDTFYEKFKISLNRLNEKFFPIKELHGRSLQTISNKSNIHFAQNHEKVMVKFVDLAGDAKKDKKEIVKYTLGKKLSFPVDNAILNIKNDKENRISVGVADKNYLEKVTDSLSKNSVDIRDWMPTAQSVYNAYIWNYKDINIKGQNNILFNLGLKESTVIACEGDKIRSVNILYFGYNNLLDILVENKITDKPEEIDIIDVPATFLTNQGITSKANKLDNTLRPTFDLWSQEIERVINRTRRVINISESSKIFVSGLAGKINNIDLFIEGATQIKSGILNPVRNLTFSPFDSERNSIPFHPTLLTSAIGAALSYPNGISVLPKELIKGNYFRWATRAVSMIAVGIMFFAGLQTYQIFSKNNQLNLDLLPASISAKKLESVNDEYSIAVQNRNNVKNQIELLAYDTDYFDRIIAITRFLSNRLPSEITLERMSFQQGWEKKLLRKQGRALQSFIEMEDEDKRIVRMVGDLTANPALKDRYFNNFIEILESSKLFKSVEVMEKASKTDKGANNIQYDIKCVF